MVTADDSPFSDDPLLAEMFESMQQPPPPSPEVTALQVLARQYFVERLAEILYPTLPRTGAPPVRRDPHTGRVMGKSRALEALLAASLDDDGDVSQQ
jgi:hypothetical protein